MNFKLTFEFDQEKLAELTGHLDKNNILYHIEGSEITVEYLNSSQVAELVQLT